ncbi:hypothetical protein [Cellulosilyticum sp. I15G10I2]|nr:hypothetical protein [Cellulosilyticum sp. I15G10I2]
MKSGKNPQIKVFNLRILRIINNVHIFKTFKMCHNKRKFQILSIRG